jgi:hypothetical protein
MEIEDSDFRKKMRKTVFTIAKTAIKTAIVCIIYVILSQVLAPLSPLIPGLQGMLQTFVVVYVALMIVGNLTSGTVFQHIFGAARCGFVMAYLIVSLNSGIFDYTFGSVSLMVDLRVFLIIVMMLETLGLAKSVILAIDFVSQKAELIRIQ